MILIGPSPGAWPQLLEVMDPGSLEPVHKRPAKRGPILAQRRDGLGHQGRRTQIFLYQRSEPRGILVGDLHLPRQSPHPQFKLSLNLSGGRAPRTRMVSPGQAGGAGEPAGGDARPSRRTDRLALPLKPSQPVSLSFARWRAMTSAYAR